MEESNHHPRILASSSVVTPVRIVTDKSCYNESKDIINNRNVVMDPADEIYDIFK